MELSQIAPAKLNLALHVRARRADGYHDLETLFCFLGDGDRLVVRPADDLSLAITGPFGAGLPVAADNLVLRAARLLAEETNIASGAHIVLEKNLPVASGIGGGSADAAAALRLLNRLWRLDWALERLAALGAGLGADVPACIHSRYCVASGVGDVMTFAPSILPNRTPILLVNPLQTVSTPAVFQGWDREDRGPLPTQPSIAELSGTTRNDLTPSAINQCPAITGILEALDITGAELVRMSGSGATCFALYRDAVVRDRAAADIAARFPEYWMLATHSVDHDFSG
ncbi:MAG: 4-(cytidine 5'-diphospho)-2-C-methyl-D-erythritol kinase [Pseudomonadota bacterium]